MLDNPSMKRMKMTLLKQWAKTCQLRAMGNFDFQFKRGTGVSAHISRFQQILKYTERLPGTDTVQVFNSNMIIFDSFPKAWKESFLNKRTGNFDTYKLVDILQHMNQAATTSVYNNEENRRDNNNKSDNGKRGGRGWRSNMNKEK